VIKSQRCRLRSNTAQLSVKDPWLSSSFTAAVKSAGWPRVTGSVSDVTVTTGALLIGSVKSKHPENPSAAARARSARCDRPTAGTLSQMSLREAPRTSPYPLEDSKGRSNRRPRQVHGLRAPARQEPDKNVAGLPANRCARVPPALLVARRCSGNAVREPRRDLERKRRAPAPP